MEKKYCTMCKELKPIEEFNKHSIHNGKQYYMSRCKECNRAYVSAWAKTNPEKNRAKALRWLHKQKNAAQSKD
jgi:hypothetical protein